MCRKETLVPKEKNKQFWFYLSKLIKSLFNRLIELKRQILNSVKKVTCGISPNFPIWAHVDQKLKLTIYSPQLTQINQVRIILIVSLVTIR